MKAKVLIVHNYYQIPGGEDTVVANEMKMLEDNGHEVILYTRNNIEINKAGFFKKILYILNSIYNPKTVKDVKKIIKEKQIDIVHVHNTLCLISPSVYYAAVSCNIPVVQTVHNFRLLCPGGAFYRDGHICEDCTTKGLICAIKNSCYRRSKLQTLACVINTKLHRMTGIYGKINYICLTEFNKEKLLNLKQINRERVFVKPNFVEHVGEIIQAEDRENQFIFAGRLDKLKGIDLLLQEWTKMGADVPKLIVCGTGPMEDWCRNFVAENKCNVELRGFVPNDEAKKIIARSKALILPTQWYEGFPMSIVEAYSVGTPVICSNLGNCGSVVVDGVTGWKFQNIEQLSDILDEVEKKNIYCNIKCHFDEYYSAIANYNLLMNIYTSISKHDY